MEAVSEDYPSHVPQASGKVESLPRWAREHIELMTRRIEELSRQVERLKTGRPGNTTVRDYVYGPTELGESIPIRFLAESSPARSRRVERPSLDATMRGDELTVMSSEGLAVRPVGMNVVTIRWEDSR